MGDDGGHDDFQLPSGPGNVEGVNRACIAREEFGTVCMVGAGYVGALTAMVLASHNPTLQFCVVDKDASLITSWNSDQLPIIEPGLEDLLFCGDTPPALGANGKDEGRRRKGRLSNITFSADVGQRVRESDIVFICVDTPLDKTASGAETWHQSTWPDPARHGVNGLDLTNLKAAVQSIARVATGYTIIVQKSTGPCGLVPWIRDTLEELASPSASFDIISSPEFLAQGTAIHDLLHPSRIVLGDVHRRSSTDATDRTPTAAVATIKRLYTPWVATSKIITTDTWTSELAKIASNALIAQRISSINSLSALCEAANATVSDLSHIVGADPRIGPLCLRAGFGFGGSCLHKDLCCLVYLAEELGLHDVAAYWRGVIQINEAQAGRVANRITNMLPLYTPEQGPSVVAVLGFAFKKNTGDIRNTTALGLVRELVRGGLQVRVFDPWVARERIETSLQLASGMINGNVSGRWDMRQVCVVGSVKAACWRCCAVVIHTDWDDFTDGRVDWREIVEQMKEPKVVLRADGSFDEKSMRELGFRVLVVGKADAHTALGRFF